jgi:hypothetical protein
MSETLLAQWETLMTDAGWAHTVNQSKSTISFFSTTDVASFRVLIHCDSNSDQVVAVISFEKRCPATYRPSMFEIVNWLNSKRVMSGFFAVDPGDGEVRYRQSQFVRDLTLTTEFVDSFLKQTIATAKVYYDVIQKGLLGYSVQGARGK